MATRSGALPGAINADLYDDPRVIKAQLEALESRIMEFGDLETREESLIRDQAKAQADHLAVVARVQPEIDILSQLQPPLTAGRQAQLDGLHSEVVQSQAKIDGIAADLAAVRSDKEVLTHLYESRDRRREQLELSLAKAKPVEPKVEPVAAAVATPSPAAESPAAPKAPESTSDKADFDPLKTYPEKVLYELPPDERRRIVREHILWDDYRRAHPEIVSTPTAAKPRASATATARSGGIPGWLLFIVGIVVLALLLWVLQPWTWFATPGRTTPVSTAVPTVASPAQAQGSTATFSEPVEYYGLDRDKNRVIARSNVPTTARLIWIDQDKVMAESATLAQRHNLDWTVPEFTGLEKTFNMKVELKAADGKVTPSGVIAIKVLQNSRAAGGIQKPEHFAAFLKEPSSAVDRDGYVAIIRQVAPNFPGVAGLTSANLVSFVESNLGKFEVRTLTAPLTGEFAFVRADGVVGYSPVTVPTGTPVLTFDGKVLANALCANEVKVPTPPVTTVPTPTPTPTTGKCVAEVWKYEDRNRNKVKDSDEPWLQGFSFGVVGNGIQTTNASGVAVFTNLAGDRNVTVVEPRIAGWEPTGAESQTQYCPVGGTIRFYFGNARIITTTVTTPAPTPAPTAVPTPAPTPAPTPVPTKAPENAPSAPPPPPPSMTPPPTQTPWVALGTVTVTESTSCGAGCWKLTWTSPNTYGGFVLYGLAGYPRSNRVDGYATGTDTYTATLINLEAGRTYEFQTFAYPRDGSTPYRSAVMTFTAR